MSAPNSTTSTQPERSSADQGGVDVDEVIRQLADPEDESLLSAALLLRDQLGLAAETPDGDLPQVAVRLDRLLHDELELASQETTAAVRRLRDVLRVHATAAAAQLGDAREDSDLAATLTATIVAEAPGADLDGGAPAVRLTAGEIEDVVRRTIADARARAIAAAVAAVVAADQAIADAQAAHDTTMRELVTARRERIEAAIATGRRINDLAGDLQLSRQRINQIRHGVR